MAVNIECLLGEALNILLVSQSQTVLKSIQEGIINSHKGDSTKRPYECKVSIARNVDDVLRQNVKMIEFDYIIFVIDGKIPASLDEIDRNIILMGNFDTHKICLIGLDCSFKDPVTPTEIWSYVKFRQCNCIMGSIKNEEKTDYLSERLLNLAEAACGLHKGIPLMSRT